MHTHSFSGKRLSSWMPWELKIIARDLDDHERRLKKRPKQAKGTRPAATERGDGPTLTHTAPTDLLRRYFTPKQLIQTYMIYEMICIQSSFTVATGSIQQLDYRLCAQVVVLRPSPPATVRRVCPTRCSRRQLRESCTAEMRVEEPLPKAELRGKSGRFQVLCGHPPKKMNG